VHVSATSATSAQASLRCVRVRHDDTIFRVGPSTDHDRRTPLAAGVVLRVVGRHGSWLRVLLGDHDAGWVEQANVETVKPEAWEPIEVRNILIRPHGRETFVDLGLNRRAAFDLSEPLGSGGLRLRVHDATLAMHELSRYAGENLIASARVVQAAPGAADLDLTVRGGALWGYRAAWIDSPRLPTDPPGHDFSGAAPHTLRLVLRQGPTSRAWKDLTIVIDPGHGGSDPGAVGVAGLEEKQANLEVGLALRTLLERAGARVVMTRDTDKAVARQHEDELAARVRAAAEGQGDLFVSIHHNARPKIEDSRIARGSFVYYYQQQSADLAQALAAPLASAAGEPDHAFIWRSFHVIRQTWMPAVLVEVGFVSNPETEHTMREPSYAPRVAAGLLQGLERFLEHRLGTP
jgi:N-acetylmuramoyl-L-alanine amidase